MTKLRAGIVAGVLLALVLVASLVFVGSRSTHHSTAVRTVTQPVIAPGVYDTATVKACVNGLKPVTLTVPASADSMTAGRMAFYAQAHAYDKCTGRNFEATAAKYLSPAQRAQALALANRRK